MFASFGSPGVQTLEAVFVCAAELELLQPKIPALVMAVHDHSVDEFLPTPR